MGIQNYKYIFENAANATSIENKVYPYGTLMGETEIQYIWHDPWVLTDLGVTK